MPVVTPARGPAHRSFSPFQSNCPLLNATAYAYLRYLVRARAGYSRLPGRPVEFTNLPGVPKTLIDRVVEFAAEAKRQRLAAAYPAGWPKCPGCGDPVMDGSATCGQAKCSAAARRDSRLGNMTIAECLDALEQRRASGEQIGHRCVEQIGGAL